MPLNVLVTGTPLFLRRHRDIFESLTQYFNVDYLQEPAVPYARRAVYKMGSVLHRHAPQALTAAAQWLLPIHPYDARVFITRSQALESRIARLPNAPELIVHVFSMCCPSWEQPRIPYVMILDYTEALAYRNWRNWAPFASEASLSARLSCEKRAYQSAMHLFTFGKGTRHSLIEDYGVDPAKISVIGCSARFEYSGEKTFGSKRMLFYGANGSEFYRKGGDRVRSAYRLVRESIPDAKLAIVGMSSDIADPGVENHGYVSSPDAMRELFLSSDLVLAPARCDPFPVFAIEAMRLGVPCVTSDVDGIPEIVTHDVSGTVISNVSSEKLAAEAIRLLNDPQRLSAMSQRAKESAGQRFVSATVAHTVAEAIGKLPIRPSSNYDHATSVFPLPLPVRNA